jgi:hypothetical protein
LETSTIQQQFNGLQDQTIAAGPTGYTHAAEQTRQPCLYISTFTTTNIFHALCINANGWQQQTYSQNSCLPVRMSL